MYICIYVRLLKPHFIHMYVSVTYTRVYKRCVLALACPYTLTGVASDAHIDTWIYTYKLTYTVSICRRSNGTRWVDFRR